MGAIKIKDGVYWVEARDPGLRVNFVPSEKSLADARNFGKSFAEQMQENLKSN